MEEKKSLNQDIKLFFRRLENKDKLYLLNNLKIFGKKEYRRVYYDLIMRSKGFYRSFKDANYEEIDEKLKNINKYIDRVAEHFYRVRNFVLHEAIPITSLATIDREYGLVSIFAGYFYKKNNRNPKSRKRHSSFFSEIEISEFQNIIKRGVLNKIRNPKIGD